MENEIIKKTVTQFSASLYISLKTTKMIQPKKPN